MLQNTTAFGGQDITHTVATHKTRENATWKAEAECLLDTIKVGEIDTKSVGCMASDVVLYTSLIVILGVILVKFGLAVIFGWFLSWKLGNFKKEGKTSYKDRMRRDLEIEDWTTGINIPAEAIRPHTPQQQYYNSPQTKKKNIIPRKSRFTQPDTGSMHFNAIERPGSAIWKQSTTGYVYMHNIYVSLNLIYVRYLDQESLEVILILLLEFYPLDLRGQHLKIVEVLQKVLYLVDHQKHLDQAKLNLPN